MMATLNVTTFDGKGGSTQRTETIPDSTVNNDLVRQRLTAFLALPTPTAAQTAKAIKALVRLALAQLDDISDT